MAKTSSASDASSGTCVRQSAVTDGNIMSAKLSQRKTKEETEREKEEEEER